MSKEKGCVIMKIQAVVIDGFKNLSNVKITFDNITALVALNMILEISYSFNGNAFTQTYSNFVNTVYNLAGSRRGIKNFP